MALYQGEYCIIPSGEVRTICGNIRVSVPISSDVALLSVKCMPTIQRDIVAPLSVHTSSCLEDILKFQLTP